MSRIPIVLLCAALGGLAGAVAGSCRRPAPDLGQLHLQREPFHLQRPADNPLAVQDSKWQIMPLLWPDFDLVADVELGENMDLDVVLRYVTPRPVGSEALPFQARFTVLRLSTRAEAPAWRTRTEALVADRPGGVLVAPGLPSSLRIEGRGRTLRANVAGRWLPPMQADDEHGSLALIAHGGKAVVRTLDVQSQLPRLPVWTSEESPLAWAGLTTARLERWWPRAQWPGLGALGGVLVALLAAWRRTGPAATAVAAAALPVASWLAAAYAFAGQLPLLEPEPGSLAAVTGAGLPLGLALACGCCPWVAALVGTALAAGAAGYAGSVERPRSAPQPAVDALFGPAAGEQLLQALASRVPGVREVHTPEPATHRVFLLGGQMLWSRGAPDEHLEVLVKGALAGRWQKPVDVPCLPTVDGHAAQQWALFARFYTGYRPQVLVFGVPRDEAAPGADGQPRSDAARLRTALAAARDWCAGNGSKLVLVADAGLPAELAAVLQEFAAAGVPRLAIAEGEAPPAIARRLADLVQPLVGK